MRHALSILLLTLLLAAPAIAGELSDAGPAGIMFHDDESGLTWFDPIVFQDISRQQAEDFLAAATVWRWATQQEVFHLIGSTTAGGVHLETVMGTRIVTIEGGEGPQWTGIFAEGVTNDGGFARSTNAPDYDFIGSTGNLTNTHLQPHGAWMVTASDPLTQPRLDHLGSATNPFFFDQETSFYWQDPANFAGQDRAAIQAWLDVNGDWRWADIGEVADLLGKFTVGDVPLAEVLGQPQFGGGPGVSRWIGYCAGIDADDAAIMQAGSYDPVPLLTLADIQSDAASWNPGAWIVSGVNPTPVRQTTLSDVKARFRD